VSQLFKLRCRIVELADQGLWLIERNVEDNEDEVSTTSYRLEYQSRDGSEGRGRTVLRAFGDEVERVGMEMSVRFEVVEKFGKSSVEFIIIDEDAAPN